jgi:tmRNA-binding protein
MRPLAIGKQKLSFTKRTFAQPFLKTMKVITKNKRAHFDYEILKQYEA